MSYVFVTQEANSDGYEKAITSEYEDLVKLLRCAEGLLFDEAKSQASYTSSLDSDYTLYVYHDDKNKLLEARAEIEVLRQEALEIFNQEKIKRNDKNNDYNKQERLKRISVLEKELEDLKNS